MKAVILVGGKATRLLPLTANTPKAMVPVLNVPFLEHVIRHLSRHEVKEVVLAQGHLAQSIERYLGDGSQLGVRLHYSNEDIPLGTAGAVKNAERYLDDTFLVLNGDIFTDLDITDMTDFHRAKKAVATIALTPVDDPTSYGLIETTPDGRVTRFLEKPKRDEVTTNTINAGTYVLEPEVLARIPPGASVSFEREVFPQLLAEGKPVYGYSSAAYWIDIGTPEKYLRLHHDLLTGKCRGYDFVHSQGKSITGKDRIHSTVQISGEVIIGANCSIGAGAMLIGPLVIGKGCIIEEDCVIEQSVIWDGVRIEQYARVSNSIVAKGCCLESGCTIVESILGDEVTVDSGSRVEPGSKVTPGMNVEAKGKKSKPT
ncbi:MAG: NDP-sugar synthase [Chloroflexi bacterium]|nr:NDP-sugar synthase [Chloroflexota bacterium]